MPTVRPNQPKQPSLEEVQKQLVFLKDKLPTLQRLLLEFLVEARANTADGTELNEFERDGGAEVLLRFEMKQAKIQTLSAAQRKTYLVTARKLVSSLSVSLRLYYCELPEEAPDKVLIHIEEPKDGEAHRYEPKVSYIPKKASAETSQQLWFVGDNVAALKYVTERIPELNRIDETFVRWVDKHSSLYGRSPFAKFLEALKGHKLLYRAVLGPMTDSAISQEGGLRDVLANRSVDDLPPYEVAAKVYRLHHHSPLLNFTLLYYFDDENKFYKRTRNTEVLFGFGVFDQNQGANATVVYRSKDRRLFAEFQRLFQALRNEEVSRELDINQPDQFLEEPRQCDVLATFETLPKAQILRKLRASGSGSYAAKVNAGSKTEKDYRPSRPHVRICVSALHFLDDQELLDELKAALGRGVQVSIALWDRGPFLELRTKVIGVRPDAAAREIEGSRSAVTFLGAHNNLFVHWCTCLSGSVSIFWIDDFIYFSPYWIGRNVAAGPHFLVAATSETGKVIQEQYRQMLKGSR